MVAQGEPPHEAAGSLDDLPADRRELYADQHPRASRTLVRRDPVDRLARGGPGHRAEAGKDRWPPRGDRGPVHGARMARRDRAPTAPTRNDAPSVPADADRRASLHGGSDRLRQQAPGPEAGDVRAPRSVARAHGGRPTPP